jgi:hypothetical protein
LVTISKKCDVLNKLNNKSMDYTFAEWSDLSQDEQFSEQHKWSPYSPGIGAKTQKEIIKGFNNEYGKYKNELLFSEYGYVGFSASCLWFIVSNSKIRFPNYFEGCFLNKGIIQKELGNNTYVVKWRVGGSNNIIEIKNGERKNLGLYNFKQSSK